jgi:hypothetical protein
MPLGPYIKLAVDLHELDRYFPLDKNLEGGLDYELIIDRKRFEEVAEMLQEFKVSNRQAVQEFCYIILWIAAEMDALDAHEGRFGKYRQMWDELADLKEYLLHNRVTGITLTGESENDQPADSITLSDGMNIDRICDGLRSVFRKEFQDKGDGKGKAGQAAWKRKRMGLIRDSVLKYLDSVPKLEFLPLESQYYIIGKLAAIAGFFKDQEEFREFSGKKDEESYRFYLVQGVKALK